MVLSYWVNISVQRGDAAKAVNCHRLLSLSSRKIGAMMDKLQCLGLVFRRHSVASATSW